MYYIIFSVVVLPEVYQEFQCLHVENYMLLILLYLQEIRFLPDQFSVYVHEMLSCSNCEH